MLPGMPDWYCNGCKHAVTAAQISTLDSLLLDQMGA